jgi:hypothetical protein
VVEVGLAGAWEQEGADVVQLGDAAFQLSSRRLRVGCGQCGERREAVGLAPDRVGEKVIRITGQRHGLLGRQRLGAGCRDGRDLEVNACGIHTCQPLGVDVA